METTKRLITENPDKFKQNPMLSILASMCGEDEKLKNSEENWYVVFKESIKLVVMITVEGVEFYFKQVNPIIAYLVMNYIKIVDAPDLELFMQHGLQLVHVENPTNYTKEQKEQEYQEMQAWLLENSWLTNDISLSLAMRYHGTLTKLLIED